jgi:hypothetical protein
VLKTKRFRVNTSCLIARCADGSIEHVLAIRRLARPRHDPHTILAQSCSSAPSNTRDDTITGATIRCILLAVRFDVDASEDGASGAISIQLQQRKSQRARTKVSRRQSAREGPVSLQCKLLPSAFPPPPSLSLSISLVASPLAGDDGGRLDA